VRKRKWSGKKGGGSVATTNEAKGTIKIQRVKKKEQARSGGTGEPGERANQKKGERTKSTDEGAAICGGPRVRIKCKQPHKKKEKKNGETFLSRQTSIAKVADTPGSR